LAVVERHRELQEQDKRLGLSKAIQSMQVVEKTLLALDQREVDARREFSSLGSTENSTRINSTSFWVIDQFIQGQRFRRLEVKQVLQQKETDVSMAYKEFLHARQQKKIMEKLRERKEAVYQEEDKRREKHNVDDLYTMRHRLNQSKEDDSEE